MKQKYIITLLLFATTMLNAQFDLTGTITDSKTNETLPNATVYIPSLNRGTAADDDGKYLIKNIPAGKYKVKFSFLSYTDEIKEVTGKNGQVILNVKMNPESPICLHQVVITAGAYSTQDETAIKIETINKEDIEGFGGVSLIKDLARIPGIDAISKGNGIATPIIRGLSTTNILVLNNGVKMQNFQFSVNHPYLIDEFGVEKIEIVKGPASLLFGSNAVGGALNMIKESPALKNKYKADLNFIFNSNTQGYVTNAGVKVSPGNLFFGLRAGTKTHKDYIDGNGNVVPNSRFNEKSIKFFTGISKDNFVSKFYMDYNLMKLGLTVPPAIKLFTGNSRKHEFWYQDLSNILISSKNILYINDFRNELNINYQTNNRKLFEDPSSQEDFNTVDMLLNTWTYEAKTTKKFRDHNFIAAIQGLSQNNKNADVPEHVLPDFRLNDFAVLSLFQLNYYKKFHTQFGLRYDMRQIDIPVQETVKNGIDKTFQNFSYSAGFTVDLTPHLLLRSNIASGYRTPSIAELSQDGGHGARYEIGNTELNPQRNYEGDISFHYHNPKLKFELSAFYNKINDYIFLSPTKDTSVTGLPVFKYLQTDATLYGYETNLGFFPANWINISLAYNYLNAQKDNGDYLPLIPQNKLRANISAVYKLKNKIFKTIEFDIDGLYAFDQLKHDIYETDTPSYKILNMSLSQRMNFKGQQMKFNIKLNNIFDATYIDHISTLKGLGYYNIGRNISVGLKVIFNGDI